MWDSKPKKITSATLGLEAKIASTVYINGIYVCTNFSNFIL